MCARPIVAMYRRTVAGFLPAFTSCSMNARIVPGSAGRNDSPRPFPPRNTIHRRSIAGPLVCLREGYEQCLYPF
jgi:hypothetical protein